MTELHIAVAAIGALVLGLGLLSNSLKKTVLSAPFLALLGGILLGPVGIGLLSPEGWNIPLDLLLEEAAQLTMAIALMGVALRLPPRLLARQWRSMTSLLSLVLPLSCLASALLVYLFLDVSPLMALLVGAVISPTDPIVATSIVTGTIAEKNIPERVRNLISAESGANDGLAHPLVLLPILLLAMPLSRGLSDWALVGLLRETLGGVVFGVALGLLAGFLLTAAERKQMIERHSFLAYTVALSLLAIGGGRLLGVNGVLAVFVTGVAFDKMVGGRERAEEENVQEAFNQFFTLPIFVLFGLLIPWDEWFALGWAGLALAGSVMLLRRLPVLLLLRPLIPALRGSKDAAYVGWFGPIGVAALLYAGLATMMTGDDMPWVAGSLMVTASVLVHGLSATPLTRLYGRSRKRRAAHSKKEGA